MYEEDLKIELMEIFDVEKVIMSELLYGGEQDVLYCNITNAKFDIGNGKECAQVHGIIEMTAAQNKLPRGWLHKRIAMITKEQNKKFFFSPQEDGISFAYGNKLLSKYSVIFTYFYEGEFNPPEKMQGVKYGAANVLKKRSKQNGRRKFSL
ncbi:MAG: hypothetical protein LBU09_00970 [Endomicrobium sp.]|jgi:hypothetical protein|nr:hypothetical protein [Endomicrobium sp.]